MRHGLLLVLLLATPSQAQEMTLAACGEGMEALTEVMPHVQRLGVQEQSVTADGWCRVDTARWMWASLEGKILWRAARDQEGIRADFRILDVVPSKSEIGDTCPISLYATFQSADKENTLALDPLWIGWDDDNRVEVLAHFEDVDLSSIAMSQISRGGGGLSSAVVEIMSRDSFFEVFGWPILRNTIRLSDSAKAETVKLGLREMMDQVPSPPLDIDAPAALLQLAEDYPEFRGDLTLDVQAESGLPFVPAWNYLIYSEIGPSGPDLGQAIRDMTIRVNWQPGSE